MKGKDFYQNKIKEAKANIKKWEAKIHELDNQPVALNKNEATKVISIRVPVSKAAETKKAFIKYILENSKSF